jgi:hypothetical protein
MEYNSSVIDFTPSKVRSMETMIVEREQALSLVHELLAQLVPGEKVEVTRYNGILPHPSAGKKRRPRDDGKGEKGIREIPRRLQKTGQIVRK